MQRQGIKQKFFSDLARKCRMRGLGIEILTHVDRAMHVQERNESLFYYVLANNIEELLPVVHMPTVSHYCQLYGLMFRSLPRSLFISMRDKGGGHL